MYLQEIYAQNEITILVCKINLSSYNKLQEWKVAKQMLVNHYKTTLTKDLLTTLKDERLDRK